MKTIVIFLLCVTVTLRTLAAPTEAPAEVKAEAPEAPKAPAEVKSEAPAEVKAEVPESPAEVKAEAPAAPAEEAPVQEVEALEVKEEPKAEAGAGEDLPALVPELKSQLCFHGWEYFRGSCYFLNNDYFPWKDAVSFCASLEATLAAVTGPLENNHLQHMAGAAGHTSAWTGGFYFQDAWRWQDGSPFGFHKFESQDSTSSFRCIRMKTEAHSGWFNDDCRSLAPSICQIKLNC